MQREKDEYDVRNRDVCFSILSIFFLSRSLQWCTHPNKQVLEDETLYIMWFYEKVFMTARLPFKSFLKRVFFFFCLRCITVCQLNKGEKCNLSQAGVITTLRRQNKLSLVSGVMSTHLHYIHGMLLPEPQPPHSISWFLLEYALISIVRKGKGLYRVLYNSQFLSTNLTGRAAFQECFYLV